MLAKSAYWSVLVVAGLHIGFMIIELTLWKTDFGRSLTGLTKDSAEESANIGLNPALYNGFLGFSLFWASFALGTREAYPVKRLFLCFIAGMGVVGAISLKNPGIFVLQALPAMIALGLNWQNQNLGKASPGLV